MNQEILRALAEERRAGILDVSDPLHIHASDNPGAILFSRTFNGKGFSSSKKAMKIAISDNNKIGIIDGRSERPIDDEVRAKACDRCNDMVICWIVNALDKNIGESVLCFNSAREIWLDMHERYDQPNGARIYELKSEIASISQGIDRFPDYFLRIGRLWDELACSRRAVVCTSGARAENLKQEQEEKLMQWLMGLNESYSAVRGSIRMMLEQGID